MDAPHNQINLIINLNINLLNQDIDYKLIPIKG